VVVKEAMPVPTIRQMRARMNSGHRQVLEAVRDGRKLVTARSSEANGLMICRATLIGWGAIEDDCLTEVGQQLLKSLVEKHVIWGRTPSTLQTLERTAWAKQFKIDSPVSYKTALQYALQDRLSVFIERSLETGEPVWAIRVFDEPAFWMEAMPTKAQATALCREMGWKIVR